MLVQTAVVNFLEWLQDPDSDIRFSMDAFQVIPQDLARRLTLRVGQARGQGVVRPIDIRGSIDENQVGRGGHAAEP